MAPELCLALADDLTQLIRLHDRELDAATVDALRQVDFPFSLALLPAGEAGEGAYALLQGALAELIPTAAVLDDLAADYAAIYLNNSVGASPYESVWLDDDHLACQGPMFELRERYAAVGLQVADWRRRYDDHLVCQLAYLRHRLAAGGAGAMVDWADLANFIDEHLGYWLPDFARRVSRHGGTAFYAGLAEVTYVWLERWRDLLAEVGGLARPDREAVGQRIRRKFARDKAEVAPLKFMPGGQGPSW